jgi:hypothetical protein
MFSTACGSTGRPTYIEEKKEGHDNNGKIDGCMKQWHVFGIVGPVIKTEQIE